MRICNRKQLCDSDSGFWTYRYVRLCVFCYILEYCTWIKQISRVPFRIGSRYQIKMIKKYKNESNAKLKGLFSSMWIFEAFWWTLQLDYITMCGIKFPVCMSTRKTSTNCQIFGAVSQWSHFVYKHTHESASVFASLLFCFPPPLNSHMSLMWLDSSIPPAIFGVPIPLRGRLISPIYFFVCFVQLLYQPCFYISSLCTFVPLGTLVN